MADHASIIQSVISGILTGGSAAATTFLTVFKSIKAQISELETKVGSDTKDPKTGIYYSIDVLNDSVRRLRREIDSWRDDPPDWMTRASRSRSSSMSMEHVHELEERVEQRLRAFSQTLKRLEEDLDRREKRLEEEIERGGSGSSKVFLTRDEYEQDSRRRSSEMAKIRENLSSANMWLRGVLSALGYIDTDGSIPPKPPALPPKKK